MRVPFNVGTDICHIPRIHRLLTGNGPSGGRRFLEKVLNEREMAVEKSRVTQLQEKPQELAKWLAGRWAAKEAAIKAHPHRMLSRHDITITRAPALNGRSQAPVALVRADEGRVVGVQDRNTAAETEVSLSISHDGEYATAVCLAPAEDA